MHANEYPPSPVMLQVMIDTVNEDGSVMKLVLYCSPTRPGWSRMISSQVRIFP